MGIDEKIEALLEQLEDPQATQSDIDRVEAKLRVLRKQK